MRLKEKTLRLCVFAFNNEKHFSHEIHKNQISIPASLVPELSGCSRIPAYTSLIRITQAMKKPVMRIFFCIFLFPFLNLIRKGVS